tara:strand:- start:233 stop:487 length:255 start_codon:yes stop_codon:yes gene_type:complete
MWKVYCSVDSLDPNPEVFTFDDRDMMDDFIYEEINRRVQFIVDHSPYTLSEENIEDIMANERLLINIVAKRIHEDWSSHEITTL